MQEPHHCADFDYWLEEEEGQVPVLHLRIPIDNARIRPTRNAERLLVATSQGNRFIMDSKNRERKEFFNFNVMKHRKPSPDGETYEE